MEKPHATSAEQPTESANVPLVVDLDDTLVRADLLIESVLLLLHTSILYLWRLPGWLMRGKAHLKRQVASRINIDAATLPYHEGVIEFLRQAREQGRPVILATAADRKLATQVASHLGLFSDVLASDGITNFSGQRKVEALQQRFGDRGFDYVGDGHVDVPVWRHARRAILVGTTSRVTSAAREAAHVEHIFPRPPFGYRTLLRALRLHQWLKNTLLFAPLIAAHVLTDGTTLLRVTAGFVAFCLAASSVYLLNDLMDLQDDRRHPHKRERPLASGALPLTHGVLMIPLLLVAALLVALPLPGMFLVTLAGYYALTLAYSLGFKRAVVIDVLILAILYTLRIIAGGTAGDIPLSFWLLAFSVFLFLSLAISKRCAELTLMRGKARNRADGRGYLVDDLALLYSLGGASGYVAVLVLALYINSAQITLSYSHPQYIWLLCPVLLYWISRLWLLTARGQMRDDPVVFAARDPGSWISGAIGLALLWLAA